jgi:hypothetical protein
MSSSQDDETPGDRLDQRERHVLYAVIHDPFPWTVAELRRDMGTEGRFAEDAISALDAAGLVHRFLVHRPVGEHQAEETETVVSPTRAARRLDELQGGPI